MLASLLACDLEPKRTGRTALAGLCPTTTLQYIDNKLVTEIHLQYGYRMAHNALFSFPFRAFLVIFWLDVQHFACLGALVIVLEELQSYILCSLS